MKKTLITIELFLILLVVVLFGFLLFIFTNKKIEPEASPTVEVISVDTSELYCGISLTEPDIESTVSLPLQISGYVNGCGWNPYKDYVARLRIFDEKGAMIGRPYMVTKAPGVISPVSSQFLLTIDAMPKTEGDIRLVFESFTDEDTTFTVPLTLEPEPPESVDENTEEL